MIGEPESEIDIKNLFGDSLQTAERNFTSELKVEFESLFGPVGGHIAKKQIQDFKGDGIITEADLPLVIDRLTESITSMVGNKSAKDINRKLRRRFDIPI